MRRVGHLFDAIVAFPNLWHAAHKAWRGKKDKERIANFYFNLEREILTLQTELVSGTYQPRPYHLFEVTDPKRREIAAADFRDRVVHHAIVNILEPFFEKRLISDTYACRLGNPKKFGGLANHQQEPWKKPLPEFIEEIYFKRFKKTKPDQVKTIEEIAAAQQDKKIARQARVFDSQTVEKVDTMTP